MFDVRKYLLDTFFKAYSIILLNLSKAIVEIKELVYEFFCC